MRRRNERKTLNAQTPQGAALKRLKQAVLGGIARGPLLIVAFGSIFVLAMVIFLYAVPLPPPAVPVATRLFDRNGETVGSLFSQNRLPVSLSQIPEVFLKGIVAIEDERFYSHHGIDPLGLIRAAARNIRAGRIVEGGSTITAQVARTLYLTQEVTFSRKLVEALLSLKLERVYSKPEILELYLNQIYLGNGSYGVEVAAQTYFGRSVKDLSLAQLAMIAGLPTSPENYSPYNHPQRAVSRRDFVLDFWATQKVISTSAAAEAKKEALTLASAGPPSQVGLYFIDYVVTLLKEAKTAGAKIPNMDDLYTGGYRIYTSLDLRLQRAADRAVATTSPAGKKDAIGVTQPQVALVALDPSNGYIVALVGGRSFAETKLNRAVPRGLASEGMRRQPGSAFKAFLYTAVLDRRFSLLATQTCEPVEFPAGSGQTYSPTDYGKEPYHYRPLSIREAIRISDNVCAVKWLAEIGPALERQFAQKMGIEAKLTNDLSLALGSSEVSVLEMARGYACLANGGLRIPVQALLRLEDRYGKVLYDPGRVGAAALRPQRAVDERVSYLMNDLLKEPFRSGGTAVGLLRYFSRPATGKTGTTDDQFDAWFVGYTPQIVCAVWVGNDQPSRLAGYGGTLAGPVWANFMAAAHEGLPVQDFPVPAGIVRAVVCAETGLWPNLTCPTVEEIFIEGAEPTQYDPTIHWTWPGETPEGARPDGAG
jgi:1A family penicillin-binding protein